MVLKSSRLRPLLLSAIALLLVPGAARAGTLDQQQSEFNNQRLQVAGGQWRAQTFTAQVNGQLDQVDMLLRRAGNSNTPLVVQIQTLTGGSPSGTVVASTTVAPETVPAEAGWVSVPISAASAAGTAYAIVVGNASAAGCSGFNQCVFWYADDTSPYTGGEAQHGSHNANWASGSTDHAFRTYVLAADAHAPETTITGGPSGTIHGSSATFTFASDESGSTFECRLDAAAWSPCSSPRTVSGFAPGTHTFQVAATDQAGNRDLSPAERAFKHQRCGLLLTTGNLLGRPILVCI